MSFERAADFDLVTAMFDVDNRRDYGETRRIALGILNGRVHMLIFVETVKGIRVISLRKANKREVKQYEQQTES
ncbi:MAG: BrnT family toxin [Methylophilaceae bacterium]